jgi:hypothetical protein
MSILCVLRRFSDEQGEKDETHEECTLIALPKMFITIRRKDPTGKARYEGTNQ